MSVIVLKEYSSLSWTHMFAPSKYPKEASSRIRLLAGIMVYSAGVWHWPPPSIQRTSGPSLGTKCKGTMNHIISVETYSNAMLGGTPGATVSNAMRYNSQNTILGGSSFQVIRTRKKADTLFKLLHSDDERLKPLHVHQSPSRFLFSLESMYIILHCMGRHAHEIGKFIVRKFQHLRVCGQWNCKFY